MNYIQLIKCWSINLTNIVNPQSMNKIKKLHYHSLQKKKKTRLYKYRAHTVFAIVFSMLTVTPTEQTCDPFLSANQLIENNWSI